MLFYKDRIYLDVARPVESDLPISSVYVCLLIRIRPSGRIDGHLLGAYNKYLTVVFITCKNEKDTKDARVLKTLYIYFSDVQWQFNP